MEQQTKTTNLKELRQPKEAATNVAIGFTNSQSFDLMQRVAKTFTNSTLVPEQYRGENGIGNCVIALNMATRMNADPLMVMQNLYVVNGRPAWSSQWIIAAINNCGKFSPLRFELKSLGDKTIKYTESYWGHDRKRATREVTVTVEDKVCIAWAIERETGERLESPEVSIEMAVKDGWYGKDGSKWKTMPDVMLRYRTASFFGKLYAPELLMGIQTVEEVRDIIDTTAIDGNTVTAEDLSRKPQAKTELAKQETPEPQPATTTQAHIVDGVDQATGEVIEPKAAENIEDPASEVTHTAADWDTIADIINLVEEAKGRKLLNKDQVNSYDMAIADDFSSLDTRALVSTKNYLVKLLKAN